MKEFDQILHKFDIDVGNKSPIEIPNVGRDSLGELWHELGYRFCVEVGVEQGKFSEVLCRGNPDMTLFGVDAWAHYSGYRDHVDQKKLDGFYTTTLERMKDYRFVAIRSFSMSAVHMFEDNSIDAVYIDANHEFLSVAQDIFHWEKKVRVGGMICGHDYRENKRFITRNHVVYVVNAYTRSYRIHPWFLLGTKEVVDGEVRDKNRSWFWIKDGRSNP